MSTSFTPGLSTAVVSGSGLGIAQGSKAMTKATEAFECGKRDSLLDALNALFDEKNNEEIKDFPLLHTMPDDLKDALLFTANALAYSNSKLAGAPSSILSHLAQTPLDFTAAIQGLVGSLNGVGDIIHVEASTLKQNGGKIADCFAHMDSLSKEFDKIVKAMSKGIDDKFENNEKSNVALHASLAKSTAVPLTAVSMGVAAAVSMTIDSIGYVFRESTALGLFSLEETGANDQEKNIYHALSVCFNAFTQTKNSRDCFKSLKDLEAAILNFKEATALCEHHVVISPIMSVSTRYLTSIGFVTALQNVNTSALAQTALSDVLTEEQKQLSQNPIATTKKASAILDIDGGGEKHCQNVRELTNVFADILKKLDAKIDAEYKDEKVSGMKASAKSNLLSTGALSVIPTLMIDFAGIMSREMSGAIQFTRKDKGTQAESKKVLASDSDELGADLDALMTRVSQLKERIVEAQRLGVSAPITLGASHIVSSGSLITALNSIIGVCFAIRELRALPDSHQDLTGLDDEEKIVANLYLEKVNNSNNQSAKSVGTASGSENMSLAEKLESIIEKIVLTHRSELNFVEPGLVRNDLNRTAQCTVNFSQGNSSGFLSGALGIIALTALETGMSSEALTRALLHSFKHSDRSSQGVDKIQISGINTNASSACNATRLSAEAVDSESVRTLLRSINLGSELTFSRAVFVTLCQSGVLRAAIKELYEEEKEKGLEHPLFLQSSLVSARIVDKIADKILVVLNEAEQGPAVAEGDAIAAPVIPGLNNDIASQFGARLKVSIATSLTAHSMLIAPFLQTYFVLRKASEIEEADLNEGLVNNEVGKALSMFMNSMRAFSSNPSRKKVEAPKALEENENNSLLSTHDYSNMSVLSGLITTTGGFSLVLDEIFEMIVSRSLTLLNYDDVNKTSVDLLKQSVIESKDSVGRSSDNSELGQAQSTLRTLTALRLTLTHFGQSLQNLANELEAIAQNEENKFIQEPVELRTNQAAYLSALTKCCHYAGWSLLQLSATLSKAPMATAGSIDDARRILHSEDKSLQFERIHTSAKSIEECQSESTLITGVVSDSAAELIVNLSKALSHGSLLGSDTLLAFAKLSEILSLHQKPEVGLSLETEAHSMPNGLSKQTVSTSNQMKIAAGISIATVSAEMITDDNCCASTQDSVKSTQVKLDKYIEDNGMLNEDEEAKLSLKKFYAILIRLLAKHSNKETKDVEVDDLIQRLNFGGISTSRFHSQYEGLPLRKKPEALLEHKPFENALITDYRFFGCDDAPQVLDTFISFATEHELKKGEGITTLLKQLKLELFSDAASPLSKKTQRLWLFIVNQVGSALYLKDQAHFFTTPRAKNKKHYTLATFVSNMLNPEAKEEDVPPPVQNPPPENPNAANPQAEGIPDNPAPQYNGFQQLG